MSLEESHMHLPTVGMQVFVSHPKWVWIRASIAKCSNDGFLVNISKDTILSAMRDLDGETVKTIDINHLNPEEIFVKRSEWNEKILPAVSIIVNEIGRYLMNPLESL